MPSGIITVSSKSPGFPSIALLGLWICSAVLLSLGLTQPIIQITVNIDSVLQEALDQQPVIGLLLQERGLRIADVASRLPHSSLTRQSIVSSVTKMFRLKCYLAALLILIFSIIVPITKQAVLLFAVLYRRNCSDRLLSTINAIQKWAMLDVFVLSMVVLALSSAAGWNSVLLGGFFWFLGYFFVASLLGILLASRLRSGITSPTELPSNTLLRI